MVAKGEPTVGTRTSSRIKAAPPVDKTNTTRPVANGKKRSATEAHADDDTQKSPPRKRGRGASAAPEKSKAKKTPAALSSSRSTRVLSNSKSSNKLRGGARINQIPVPAPHVRPAREVFIFGNGDMGQFGLGTDTLGDISRPRRHKWFEEAVLDGKLGGDGAGVEMVCAGGMHTLAIDEAGKVSSPCAALL